MLVTWFRDGRPAFIPQMTAIGGVLGGFTAASLTLGFSWSPVLLGTGAMMGLRSAASMLIGGTVAWAVLAPWLVRNGIVRRAGVRPAVVVARVAGTGAADRGQLRAAVAAVGLGAALAA